MSNSKSNSIRRKVVVVGAGAVGATYAYALSQSGLADEIIIIDGPGLEPDNSDGWAQTDKNKSPFMAVAFNKGPADFIANNVDHDWGNVRLRRVVGAKLAEAMGGMRESIEWYYDSLSSETKDDEDYVFGAC